MAPWLTHAPSSSNPAAALCLRQSDRRRLSPFTLAVPLKITLNLAMTYTQPRSGAGSADGSLFADS